ncbi:hypothetical protein EJ03DRAFT_331139 [Teratosphaeria nubilosa]|uniref:Cyclin-like domain-containing protein n=1 Tax=Teratosphaeria nubilosa TaxID=161662 RepID=A0A6G1KYY8_9PEZI|nr:hypothetical protein EJ03DRAFT_331139 [Teratosphaeria nubilosa]
MAPAAPPRTGPRQRLGTLNKPTGPKPKPKPKKQKACCDNPKHETEDGMLICMNCGTQIAENNIVAEVTFEENAQGAATVQGGFIGEGARHARSLGSQTIRRIGGGERNSRQEQLSNARRVMAPIVQRLNLSDRIKTGAENLLDIVFGWSFSAGRRTEEVVAAAVFAACRKDRGNEVLLIDIADIIKTNVFRLGEVYKDLLKCCGIKEGQHVSQELINLEPLIMRYCKRLEFGSATPQVTADAIRIAKRMRRDWIVTGRHPAGLCGASIILAARMNNFRRTVREIVFISKIADGTVARRIDEFRRTKAASLSVNDFREFGLRLKGQHDPPILQYTKEREEKLADKKRKRQEWNVRRETIEREQSVISGDGDGNASFCAASGAPDGQAAEEDHRDKRQRTSGPETSSEAAPEVRRDADGFAIPRTPSRATAVEASDASEAPKRKRGRPKKQAPTIDLSAEELEDENKIEAEIEDALGDEEVQNAGSEVENQNRDDRMQLLAEQQRRLSAQREKERRESEGKVWWTENDHANAEVLTAEKLEEEFKNDPEVQRCVLSPAESKIKEQIWVAHNEDWMRMQHEKRIMKQIAEANGTNKKERGKGRKKKLKKGEQAPEDAETPAETPANAAAAAARKAAPPSKFLNFETLARIYGGDPSSPSISGSNSRAPSEPPSVSTSARTGAELDSATPAPPRPRVTFGLQSPQATQGAGLTQREPASPAMQQQPVTPPPTQPQATEGADDEDEDMGDDEEDEQGYQQSVVGYDDDDISEVQDVGYADDDFEYQSAINDGVYGTFGGDDYDDY